MKKIIFAAALLMWCGSSIAIERHASETEYNLSADWADYTTVTAVKHVNGRTFRNHSIRIQRNDSGDLRAHFGSEWRTVYSSDRSGYAYMFYAGTTAWYFNL